MTADTLLDVKPAGRRKHKNVLAGAVNIAIRDAEIHGTKLVVKRKGVIEELTPDEMRARLKSDA